MVLFDFVLAISGKLVKRFNSNRQFSWDNIGTW